MYIFFNSTNYHVQGAVLIAADYKKYCTSRRL
jgi:hypothetical protein